jgi:hypothetical protein
MIGSSTCGDPQPTSGWRTRPNVGPARPSAASVAPIASGRRPRPSVEAAGIIDVRTSVTITNGTLMAKIQRHDRRRRAGRRRAGPTTAAMLP